MTDADFDAVVALEDKANELELGLKGLQEGLDQLTAKSGALAAGFKQAKQNLTELRAAPVVSLGEWSNVSSLAKSFVAQQAKLDKASAEMTGQMAQARAVLAKIRADLAAKYLADATIPDNILEFPSAI